MIRYAKIVDEQTKVVSVGLGTDIDFYKSIGMTEIDVEQAYNGQWYVKGYAPEQPAPTHDEQSKKREAAYILETDPIQTHIDRLKDGEQTPEIVAEIEALRIERDEKIAAIKERYPYPTDPVIESEENADTQN